MAPGLRLAAGAGALGGLASLAKAFSLSAFLAGAFAVTAVVALLAGDGVPTRRRLVAGAVAAATCVLVALPWAAVLSIRSRFADDRRIGQLQRRTRRPGLAGQPAAPARARPTGARARRERLRGAIAPADGLLVGRDPRRGAAASRRQHRRERPPRQPARPQLRAHGSSARPRGARSRAALRTVAPHADPRGDRGADVLRRRAPPRLRRDPIPVVRRCGRTGGRRGRGRRGQASAARSRARPGHMGPCTGDRTAPARWRTRGARGSRARGHGGPARGSARPRCCWPRGCYS